MQTDRQADRQTEQLDNRGADEMLTLRKYINFFVSQNFVTSKGNTFGGLD